MSYYDPSHILRALKETSPFDVFLLSFLLLPFVFNAWLGVLEKLEATQRAMLWSLGVVVFCYVIGIIAMLVGTNRVKRRETAHDLIVGYLQDKNFRMMTFERIRERINASYKDEFLKSVIKEYPEELRHARLKGGKIGVARIAKEEDEGDQA